MPDECDRDSVEATLRIPFPNSSEADIAHKVLSVDREPLRNFVEKTLIVDGTYLQVQFKADQVKNLRTAITSFFEALLLCTDTIREFGPADARTYSSTNTS